MCGDGEDGGDGEAGEAGEGGEGGGDGEDDVVVFSEFVCLCVCVST
jgi:hypothetical protein